MIELRWKRTTVRRDEALPVSDLYWCDPKTGEYKQVYFVLQYREGYPGRNPVVEGVAWGDWRDVKIEGETGDERETD